MEISPRQPGRHIGLAQFRDSGRSISEDLPDTFFSGPVILMPSALLFFKLSIQSSYIDQREIPADELNYDTVQWWLTEKKSWYFRTYAIDKDMHVYNYSRILGADEISFTMKEGYGGSITQQNLVRFEDPLDQAQAEQRLKELLGKGRLIIHRRTNFGFWNPGDEPYGSQSLPE